MLVKLVKGSDHQTFECRHINKVVLTGSKVQSEAGFSGEGVLVTLSPEGRTLRLPDDGDVVYVMNDEGKTVDTIRWPDQTSARHEKQEAVQ